MAQQIELTGGESVYCINQFQLKQAFELAHDHPESSKRIQDWIGKLEDGLSRNEQAALAFVLIDRLLKTTESPPPAPTPDQVVTR